MTSRTPALRLAAETATSSRRLAISRLLPLAITASAAVAMPAAYAARKSVSGKASVFTSQANPTGDIGGQQGGQAATVLTLPATLAEVKFLSVRGLVNDGGADGPHGPEGTHYKNG